MRFTTVLIVLVLTFSSLLAAGCAVTPVVVKMPLQDEGELFVYVEPFPDDAHRLAFTVDRISVIRSDGEQFPLALALGEFKRGEMKRQRFAASGRVPPGQYRGLSVSVTKASLAGDEGESSMLVPQEPVTADFLFEVRAKQAVVVSLALRYAESVRSQFNFTPVFSVFIPAWPASGLLGFTANKDDHTLTVFDKKSGRVSAMIATGRGPEAIVLDQKAAKGYISLSGEDRIEVLDLTGGRFVNDVRLNPGDAPGALALTPDGKTLLVLDSGARTLSFVDTGSLIEQGRVLLGDGPRSLLVDGQGRRCYVFNAQSGTVQVIDIANRATLSVVSTDPAPTWGQFNRRGDKLFVIHEQTPYLSVYNPTTLALLQRAFVGPGLNFIRTDPVTDMLYASRKQERLLEVYDPFTLVAGAYIPAMRDIVYMTIDSQENNLLVVSRQNKELMSINLVSRKITAETDLGGTPSWLTVMGER